MICRKKHLSLIITGLILLCLLIGLFCFLPSYANANSLKEEENITLPQLRIGLREGLTLEQINSGSKDIKYEGNNITVVEDESKKLYNDLEIKGRGNTTWGCPKKPYQIKFDSKVNLFGLGKSKKWVLLANYYDAANVRNDTAFYIASKIGFKYHWNGQFVNLYVNDEYIGLYWITHKVEIGNSTIDIGKQGSLYETDFRESKDLHFFSDIERRQFVVSDVGDDMSESDAINSFRSSYNSFERSLFSHDWQSVSKKIDVDSFINYFLLTEFSYNPDGYSTSWFFYKENNSDVIHCAAPWDYDLAFGDYPESIYRDSFRTGFYWKDLSARLMDFPEFRQLVIEKYKNSLQPYKNDLTQHIDKVSGDIHDDAVIDAKKWGFEDVDSGVKKLKRYIDCRFTYLDSILAQNVKLEDGLYNLKSDNIDRNFLFEKMNDGNFRIKDTQSNQVLSVKDFSPTLDNEVILMPWAEQRYQEWSVSKDNEKFRLFNRQTGLSLYVGAHMRIKDMENDEFQRFNLTKLESKVSSTTNKEETKLHLEANCDNLDKGTVKFAYWSDKAQKVTWVESAVSSKTYTYDCNLNISECGSYTVHAYYKSLSGAEMFLGSSKFSITETYSDNIYCTDKDENLLTFKVNIDNIISPSGPSRIKFAIWSEAGGQDDIRWDDVAPVKYKGEAYKATLKINLSDHKYNNGIYNIHVYAYAKNGSVTNLCQHQENIQLVKQDLRATLNSTETSVYCYASNPVIQGGYVKFAVWSDKGGQDDLRWYKTDNSTVVAFHNVPIINHKNEGLYNVHAYYFAPNGQQVFLGGTNFTVSSIPKANIEITDKNPDNLTFKIKVNNIKSPSGISVVKYAVWSDKGGQDDIKWSLTSAQKESDGTYSSYYTVKLSDHKYENGKYNVHIYTTANNGVEGFLGSASENIDLVKQELKATLDSTETYVYCYASSPVIQGGYVKFAVWSDKGGQDDLRWYKTDNSTVVAFHNVPIINHKNEGLYNVHAYYFAPNGQQVFLGGTNFTVSSIPKANIEITDKNPDNLTFKVKVNNIKSPSGISVVKYAVWSDKGGQDDIKWSSTSAQKESDGTYSSYYTVKLSDHKYENGKYNIHIYTTANNGVEGFLGSASENIDLVKQELKATLNSTETSVYCYASNPIIQGGYVKFAVWSEKGGQDDLRWYKTDNSNVVAFHNVAIINHKNEGLYNVHAYYFAPNGSQAFFGGTSFTVSSIPKANIEITDKNPDSLTFKVNVSNIKSPSGISVVKFAVWSEKGGQDDIKWTTAGAQQQADGTYSSSYVVKLSDHWYDLGNYIMHVYTTANNGVEGFLGSKMEKIDFDIKSFTATLNEDQTVATITMCNPALSQDGVLKFAVWSEASKQKDIRWFNVDKIGNIGRLEVPINLYKQLGTYLVHAYFFKTDGEEQFLGNTSFKVEGIAAKLSTSNVNPSNGTFTINVTEVKPAVGIARVQVPTWSEVGGTSHAVWYQASIQPDGAYRVNADVRNHDEYFGKYTTHLYITMTNGCECFLGGYDTTIIAKNYVTVINNGYSIFTAMLKGAESDIVSVKFPTWSISSTTDTKWYDAAKRSDGSWTTNFSARMHWPAGEFMTHCYVYRSDGSSSLVGSYSYTVSEDDVCRKINPPAGHDLGMDVSEHQGDIDWHRVLTESRVGFAMIRIGFGTTRADYKFEQNYVNALKEGIPVGGYWYSYARSVDEARAEGKKCAQIMNGRLFDLPIAFDLEEYHDIDPVTNALMTNAFCDEIQKAKCNAPNESYHPMLYSSESFIRNEVATVNVNPNIYWWVASWSHSPEGIPYPERLRMWQYTSGGTVSGISGNVDLDKLYY